VSVGNSIMMQTFVEACLASMEPRPKRAFYIGTLALFFTDASYMTVRLALCEAYEPSYVEHVCSEWRKACAGDHAHANRALNSGPCDGRATAT